MKENKKLNEKNDLYAAMGSRLREHRHNLHYTQERTAELLEISLTYYGRIERGQNGLSLEKMVLAHERLSIDLQYLLTGEKSTLITFDGLLSMCPREKRYELENLIRYALELTK